MKKLIMTIAIVLGMGMSTFAQEVEVYEEKGLFGMGKGIFRGGNGEEDPLLNLPGFGEEGDVDADTIPLGSGIAVLMGLGAAYLVGKRRKED
jgi:hypothetical protein